jgi:Mrp family chromosome partitioning ATPase
MLRRRRGLPVLAEISGSAGGDPRVRSLRRADLEALRRVRREIEGERTVLVAGDAELAVALALALAAAAAADGRRAVLLECDLLAPRLAAALGLIAKPGLHEYLRWEASAPQILQPLALAGPSAAGASHPLVCVVAGEPAPNPRALIDLESFRHAIAKLRAAYDQVFLLSPPLDSGAGEIEAIAAQADTLLAAVSPAGGSGRARRALVARLRKLPVRARGAIVVADA